MKNKVMPPTIFYCFIALILLVDFLFPHSFQFPLKFLGIFLITLGFVFDIGAWMQFKRKTTLNPFKKPSKFVKEGFYRISRNPQYLGMDLFLWGLCFFAGSIIAFIFPILFIILVNKIYIKEEEENMGKKFGKKYLKYKKRVRKWL